MANDFPTGTITLVFTDIEGSSALWEQHDVRFRSVLDTHNRLIRELLLQWDGYEVKTQGDSFMIAFRRASEAVQCAIDIQRTFTQHQWPSGEVLVRIGMHTGEPFLGYDPGGRPDYFGPVVNRAARVASAGHGGQILISSATYDTVQGALTGDVEVQDLGYHRLRGIEQPEHIFEVRHADLPPRQFAPLKTLLAEQVHLPNFPTPFLGRTEDIERIKTLLMDNATHLLNVLGPGGIGKTRLSARVAEEVAERFLDGVRFIDLESARTAHDLFAHLAQHLDIMLQSNKSEEQCVLDFLAGKKLLLLLDNVEQIGDLPAALDRLIAAGTQLKCIVTSRERLQMSGAHVFEVAPLPVPQVLSVGAQTDRSKLLSFESVQFFVSRARQHLHSFQVTDENAADIARLCQQLEGVPLALELAAAWIADLSPAEILEEMEQQLDVLSVESTNVPERQRAMRSSIDWSFMRLSAEEQQTLVLLSIFSGGFTREAVSFVCQINRLHTATLLRRLNAKSLLTHTEIRQQTRFGMLYTIRRYLQEQLAQHPDAHAAQERHAQFFLQLVRERLEKLRTPDEAAALSEIEDNLDNLRTALEWSKANQQHSLTAALALHMGQFLERSGLQKEALRFIETGLSSVQKLTPNETENETEHELLLAALLRERASLHLDQKEWDDALQPAQQSLRLSREHNDLKGAASAYNLLGLAACRSGNFEAAHQYFEEAETAFRQAHDAIGQSIVWHNLGLTASESGDTAQATKYLQQALQLRREHGDRRGLAETLNNLGVIAQEQGDLEQAAQHYQQSLECGSELQDSFAAGRALFNMGEIAELKNDAPRAVRLFAAAERLFSEIGSAYRPYAEDSWRNVANALGQNEADMQKVRISLKEHDLRSLCERVFNDKNS